MLMAGEWWRRRVTGPEEAKFGGVVKNGMSGDERVIYVTTMQRRREKMRSGWPAKVGLGGGEGPAGVGLQEATTEGKEVSESVRPFASPR